MSEPNPARPEASHGHGADFTATHWTQVALAAQKDGSAQARAALESLCLRYWPAIYSFLRRQAHSREQAEDLTQGFFGQLLEENAFARADRTRGRFRSFLLGALRRYLADQQRKDRAQKRGGWAVAEPLDFEGIEAWYLEEADPGFTPDEIFDQRWAANVLEAAFRDLHAEFKEAGQEERFTHLQRFLAEAPADGDYERDALKLGVHPRTVASAVSRLRQRYRELVRRNVLLTVGHAEQVDPEFHELFRAG